eukprot:TRINITY_DN14006_c0_g1_i2.p1 TRINITY_DN14006_c0_g1~~TRINITY_DN14006_c0_g1_i2.p1  ORF type:complete len:385 (-),score=62.86 TRINITY_DN14006_c0_g1_i2:398-1552(-)
MCIRDRVSTQSTGNHKQGNMGNTPTKATALHKAELKLLEAGRSHFQTEDECDYEIYDVPIAEGETVHTLRSCAETADKEKPPLVLIHGYGAGIAMWFATIPLLRRLNREILAIDTPGCGLSSRPCWEHGDGADCDVDVAEDFFVERIEQWRAASRIDKMVLAAHSMGGYLSVCYAEKYPQHVEKLVLISPAGIPKKPVDFKEKSKDRPWYFRAAGHFWESGHSPFSYIKYGPGRFLLGKYVDARFNDEPWIPKPEVLEYTYLNWTQGEVSAGGRMHSTLLEPGAFARRPLCERIPELDLPMDFIYGTTDWMDYRSAMALRTDAKPHAVMRVASAGHNVMVDNPMGMVEALESALGGEQGAGHGKQFAGGSFMNVFKLSAAKAEA